MSNKKSYVGALLEYGFIKAYLFVLTTTLAFINLITILAVLFVSWWHKIR